jgi:hypothetical protein
MKKLLSEEHIIANNSSDFELALRERQYSLFKQMVIPDNEILANLPLFMDRQLLSRILFLDEIYKKIVPVNGVIFEFGVRWGSNLALLSMMRGIYEPFNLYRKIVGFDTFSGFPAVHEKDGDDVMVQEGSHTVTDHYEQYLYQILDFHENNSPINHIKKFELVKGDASITLSDYLNNHPETIISLAYFDFDIYEPTKKCLELILDYVTKGTVIAFDELNYQRFPGETVAFKEILGLSKYQIVRSPNSGSVSYIVVD